MSDTESTAPVEPASACEPPIQLLHFALRLDSINDFQLADLRRTLKRARAAHFTDIDMRINGQNERSEADWLKHIQEVCPDDVATPTGHAAEEALCVHLCLDQRRIPRTDHAGAIYSLWGRVGQYLQWYLKQLVNADARTTGESAQNEVPAK